MQTLIDRLRRARETIVTADGRNWTVRRPTDAQACALAGVSAVDLVARFIVGWELREMDLVPGGSADPVPFDAALWAEWLADQPQLWAPLSEAILNAYLDHRGRLEDAAKN